jgi:hypothetical protein
VVRFLRSWYNPKRRIIIPRIFSSSPPYGKYLASVFAKTLAPRGMRSEDPQQTLPEMRTPIIPPRNPVLSPLWESFPNIILRNIHAIIKSEKRKILIIDAAVSIEA